jgi:hypothetical protein
MEPCTSGVTGVDPASLRALSGRTLYLVLWPSADRRARTTSGLTPEMARENPHLLPLSRDKYSMLGGQQR